MLHCPITKHFCLSLCTVKCRLLSEWITRANPNFIVCFSKISNYGTAMLIQVFLFFTHQFDKNLTFSSFFCKLVTIYISGKLIGKLIVIQTSTDPNNSVHISCIPNACFVMLALWVCTFLEDEMSILEFCHQ